MAADPATAKLFARLGSLAKSDNLSKAVKVADRGYVIVHGQIEFEGKDAESLSNNEMIKQYYLGL